MFGPESEEVLFDSEDPLKQASHELICGSSGENWDRAANYDDPYYELDSPSHHNMFDVKRDTDGYKFSHPYGGPMSVFNDTFKNPKKLVAIQHCQKDWHGIGTMYLVRGFGKRAIKVVIRPFLGTIQYIDDYTIALEAAKVAAKKRWRLIFVELDTIDGEEARGYNPAQMASEVYMTGGHPGVYVCYVGESKTF